MNYLLIRTDLNRFFQRELAPDEFVAHLKKIVGDSLEEVDFVVGGLEYHYFAAVEDEGLRPKLFGVPGVSEVLVFGTKPLTD